ncbi:enhancer of mRNA-decapping protein 4 [Coccinella septempunctata]|uniref:enhancer of mRNA-decapping protein 4 n=1 Tax=Coccinella septempunctata TaxID=41139 RepID=UPI001D083784|nr:enhancer of mRNA-decapping protein 4 [Coccinella septempunctata]
MNNLDVKNKMNPPPLALKSDEPQIIKYGGESDYTVPVDSKELVIHCKAGGHSQGSSKVKLINKIDYNWEVRFYHGQLVAVHIEGKVLAFAMKGKDGGMVRVVNQETNQRALIKNLKTDVRDVSFAFLKDEIILGCVDDIANIFIYEIEDTPHFIKFKLLLHIYHTDALNNPPANYRMVWCPYLPSADDDPEAGDETAKMFVFLNGSKAEVWDVCSILSKNPDGPVKPDENHEGYVEIVHSMHVVDVSFSSDGTAIATACLDGYVKFYQVYMGDNEKQKLLHEWVPHESKPLSCLIFIDNVLEYSSDSRFWKFAITGANHNSELKLWSCESWTCLQTIHFKLDPTSLIPHLFFKIGIDHSGQYVVMSDINNRILYVMQIQRSDAEKLVAVKSISQFLLPATFLSFHITKAEARSTPFISNSDEDLYDTEEFDEDAEFNGVNINMLVIQPKKFQECNIVFTPESYEANFLDNIHCDNNTNSNKVEVENVPKLDDLQSSVTLLIQQQTSKSQHNLMTPEDFTPGGLSRASSVRNSIEPTQEKSPVLSVENEDDFERPQKGNFASGGSSPSREVQEILSLNNSAYSNPEYYENLSKMQESEAPTKIYNQKETVFPEVINAKEMIWPKIPVVKDNGMEVDTSVDFNLIKDEPKRDDITNSQLQALNFRLAGLETALREQTKLIESLKKEMLSNKLMQNSVNVEIRDEVAKELEVAMSKHQLQMAKFLESFFSMNKFQDREMYDTLLASISEVIIEVFVEKTPVVFSHEMKHTIVPTVMKMMENLKHQLDNQFSQKANQTDLFLKDSITGIVENHTLTDTISRNVASTVGPLLEKCYRDMITNNLIPSCEKVCGNMFQQINDTFVKGTREYATWVETYLERQRKSQERGKDLVTHINAASDNLKLSSEQLLSTLNTEIQKNMISGFKSMQDILMDSIKEKISEEVKKGFKSQASVIEDSVMNAVRSRSVTPAPHMVDSHVKFSKIRQHLSSGEIEEALKLALSAENLQYVVYVCEKVDVNSVFGGSICLPQSCLLALIQQLSMDLTCNTEVKLSYIHAAILGLNRNDPNTKHFVKKVLKDLALQLNSFINSNPPYKFKSTASILLMAIENVGSNMFNMSI